MEPWQGKSVWVWYLDKCEDGDVGAIITKAIASKIDSLLIKAHDGPNAWPQFGPMLVAKLHEAGIKVGAWGYCYGSNWQVEANNAITALNMGADFYVADVENEFEKPGMAATAAQLMAAIRRGAPGKPIGFSSFGVPDYHASFPWKTFAAMSDFVMPQVYWGDFGMDSVDALRMSVSQCKPLDIPVVPTGQAYNEVSSVSMASFAQAAGLTCPGVSWWSWQHATQAMWGVIGASEVTRKEVIPTLKFGDSGESVKTLQTQLNTVLGTHIAVDGQYGNGTTAAVKSFQQIAHLAVDGIAGPSTMDALASRVKVKQPEQPVAKPTEPATPQPTVKEQVLALLASSEADLAKAKELINSL